jgi:hypothetical protein
MPLIIDGPQDTDLGTWDQLIDEVLLHLAGYTEDQESYGRLAVACGATDQSLTLDDVSQFSRGLVEIDEELLFVQRKDEANGRLAAVIRGFRGSTAVAHPEGALLRDNPRFPRVAVRRALEATLRAMWPRLFAVDAVEIETTEGQDYELPAACSQVLTVEVAPYVGSADWNTLSHWSYNGSAPSNVSATGKSIRVRCGGGRVVRVKYARRPVVPEVGDDWDTTGLPDSCRDVVVLGACHRLMSMAEIGRGSQLSAEAQALNQTRPAGSGITIAKYFLALYEQRLTEEQLALHQQVQVRSHKRA